MKIHVKGCYVQKFCDITVEHEHTNISLGLMNDDELRDMAVELMKAIYEIGPSINDEFAGWVKSVANEAGVLQFLTSDKEES